MTPPSDSSAIQIHLPGRLRHVLPAPASACPAATAVAVETRHCPAGLLRERVGMRRIDKV